jgi:hypothetical protein
MTTGNRQYREGQPTTNSRSTKMSASSHLSNRGRRSDDMGMENRNDAEQINISARLTLRFRGL